MRFLRIVIAIAIGSFAALACLVGIFDNKTPVSGRAIGIAIIAVFSFFLVRCIWPKSKLAKTSVIQVHSNGRLNTVSAGWAVEKQPAQSRTGTKIMAPKASPSTAPKPRNRDGTRRIGVRMTTNKWGGDNSTPFTLDDWDAFADESKAQATEFSKTGKALMRIKTDKLTAEHLKEVQLLHRQSEDWLDKFLEDSRDFIFDREADERRSDRLLDKVQELIDDLEAAHFEIVSEFEWRESPDYNEP